MPYSRPTLLEIINRIISDFNNRVSSSMTFLRRSFFRIAGYVFGGAVYLTYEYISYVKDQMFISKADAEHLDRHGAEYGIYRDAGSKATGSITITGTATTVVPAFTELKTDDGYRFRTDSSVTIGAGGSVSADITAVDFGDGYNQASGATLSFISPISGINTSATISGAITDGEAEETDSEFRSRLLTRKRYPPHGGIEADYSKWAKEYSGVTRAWTVAEYNGIGTIGVGFVLDDADDIFPDSTTRAAIKDYIVSHTDSFLGVTVGAPVTAEPGLFIIPASAKTVNFDIDVYPNTTDIQSDAEEKLAELILQSGGIAQTITISEIYEAVMAVADVQKCRINTPSEDSAASTQEVHVLGDVTWGDY